MDSPADKRRIHEVLNVPEDLVGITPDNPFWYNENSRLIVLEGPHGNLLARYTGNEYPDPHKHEFMCAYTKPYTEYETTGGPPNQAPPDVTAIAHPILTQNDTKDVSSAAGGTAVDSTGEQSPSKVIVPGAGNDDTLRDQTGVKVTPARLDAHVSGSGFALDEGGMHMKGDLEQPHTKRKGIGRESPLFGFLPKSFITFFATDYLPDIKQLQEIQKYVEIAIRMPDLYRGLQRFVNELGGDMDDLGDPNVNLPDDTEDVTG